MISYLKGIVKFTGDSSLCLVCNNIGWNVNVASSVLYSPEQELELFIYTHVRETEISFWGFKDNKELNCFKLLIGVSGIGPRTAHALIGDKGIREIYSAILNNKPEMLKGSGIGLKTSQKIVFELKSKIALLNLDSAENPISQIELESKLPESVAKELVQALTTLGYKQNDIQDFINKLKSEETESKTVQDLIKQFLRS